MQSLNDVIKAGKVLYLGVSVSKANQYARDHGLRQFSVYEGMLNAAARDLERDIIPMCVDEGMGIQPWSALGGGRFKTEEQRAKQQAEQQGRGLEPQPENVKAIVRSLDTIARRKGTLLTSVAFVYVMHKTPYVFPIVGGRKLEHLKANIEVLSLELTEEEIEEIEAAAEFDIGFPLSMLGRGAHDSWLNNIGGVVDHVKGQKPIAPRKL